MSNNTPHTIRIPLSKTGKHAGKFETIVDASDADLAELNWRVHPPKRTSPYAVRNVYLDGKYVTFMIHRVIMERVLGRELKKGELIDHINGDSLLNTRSNLRLATHEQNQQNVGLQKNNSTGYKGVFWDKDKQKFRAKIEASGKRFYLGYFDSAEAAYKAYCDAAIKYHKDFARLE